MSAVDQTGRAPVEELGVLGAAGARGSVVPRAVGHVGEAAAFGRCLDQPAFFGDRFERGAVLVGRGDHFPGAVVGEQGGAGALGGEGGVRGLEGGAEGVGGDDAVVVGGDWGWRPWIWALRRTSASPVPADPVGVEVSLVASPV